MNPLPIRTNLGKVRQFARDVAPEWDSAITTAMGVEFGSGNGTWWPTAADVATFVPAGWSSSQLEVRLTQTGPERWTATMSLLSVSGPSVEEVECWRRVMDEARSVADRPEELFDWYALIGRSDGGVQVATGGYGDCSMQLRPAANWIRSEISVMWPTVVEGQALARTASDAQTKASRAVRRLCALLSLQRPMAVLQAPLIGPVAPPFDVVGSQRKWSNAIAWDQARDDALTFLGTEAPARLVDAVVMFHEGATLHWSHPTLAIVAYISAIESLGASETTVACAACGNISGAAAAFREAVSEIATKPETKRRAMRIYGRVRSTAVHEAELHGGEDSLGDALFSSILLTAVELHHDDLLFAWNVARKLIGRRLKIDHLVV